MTGYRLEKTINPTFYFYKKPTNEAKILKLESIDR